MSLQKAIPVVTSIIIILIVAALRERSKTLATVFAVMPINMPLALWVLVSAGPEDANILANYVRSFIIGLVPAFIWLGVVYVLLRIGSSLIAALLGGYVVWFALIGGLFALNILTFSS